MKNNFHLKVYNHNFEIECDMYLNDKKVGSFVLDDSMRIDGRVCLSYFEIYKEFRGKGFAKHLANFVKEQHKLFFPNQMLEIEAIPLEENPTIKRKDLLNMYKRYFKPYFEDSNFTILYYN